MEIRIKKDRRNSFRDDRKWVERIERLAGYWVDVELEFLFEDQFNVAGARVMAGDIDGICFQPDFADIDEFTEKVAERYAKDWPGRKVTCSVIRSYIVSGFITVYERQAVAIAHNKSVCPYCDERVYFEVAGRDDAVGLIGEFVALPDDYCDHFAYVLDDEAIFLKGVETAQNK